MSGDGNVFDTLNEKTKQPSSGEDFADWWDPEEDDQPDEFVGIVVELHSAPRDWTEPGEVPDTIRTVMSLGRSDDENAFEAGECRTPKQHKQLKNGLEEAGIGSLVRMVFTGYEKVNGNMMNAYEVGVLQEDEWSELDGADEIRALYEAHDGISGDNRRKEPYTSSGSTATTEEDDDVPADMREAVNALRDVISIQQGSVSVDKADSILNDVRELGVDVEEVAAAGGLTIEDGEITG